MDPLFDLVKELEPDMAPPTEAARARQRARLEETIRSATGGDGRPPGRTMRRRRGLRTGPVVGAVVLAALAGGGIAAAVTLLAPTPEQATSIYGHYYPEGGVGRTPGSRPALNSEEVLCDYRGAAGLPSAVRYGPIGDAFASAAPLTTPLTAQMLVDACGTVSVSGATVPTSTPATLCTTGQPSSVTDTAEGWPVVVFGSTTCTTAGDVPPPADLLAQVNQRRNLEAAVDAVPVSCPTETQAVAWVHRQLAALGSSMQVTAWNGGSGGTCYLPFVQWWWPPTGGPLVQVTASVQAVTPGTTPPHAPSP